MIQGRKILLISPFERWPTLNGTITRTHYQYKYLSNKNIVWFAFRYGRESDEQGVERGIANSPRVLAQLFNLRFFQKLMRTVQREKIEIIFVSFLWSAIHGCILKLLTGRTLIIDTHNVEYYRFKQASSPFWPLIAIFELLAYTIADQVICVSEIDKALIQSTFKVPTQKLHVAPNGADIATLSDYAPDTKNVKKSLGLEPEQALILFYGSLNYSANKHAVDIIIDEICPRLRELHMNWRIVIAGAGAEDYFQHGPKKLPPEILFAGFVDDLVAVIRSSNVVIAPLMSGSGTRLKILESVACHRRVISTPIGAEGLERDVFGSSLIIQNNWDDFANCIANILDLDPEVLPGPDFMERYDWNHIFDRLDLL
ncbi:MAG TPA: hypothetical protein DEP47_02735 [Chloroflexi bacterium]|jgi:glycosyltransferase involved in cell wall biosynthesis|nr:hypothetical protein [Chloroflexota bacterium]